MYPPPSQNLWLRLGSFSLKFEISKFCGFYGFFALYTSQYAALVLYQSPKAVSLVFLFFKIANTRIIRIG